MEIVILVGVCCAVAAGLACYAEHGYAERHAWEPLERYVAGGLTWLAAAALVLYAAFAIEWASLVLLLLGLILGAMFVGTWAAYQKPVAMPEEDELVTKIDRELRRR